jgi:hypothetical protein
MNMPSVNPFRALVLVVALAAALCAAGCYVEARAPGVRVGVGADYYEVEGPPPPPREEVVVTQPGPDFVWVGGYWDWDLGVRHYAWREGHWERGHEKERWVAPHYEMRANRHYYRRGHWERGGEREHRERDRG